MILLAAADCKLGMMDVLQVSMVFVEGVAFSSAKFSKKLSDFPALKKRTFFL